MINTQLLYGAILIAAGFLVAGFVLGVSSIIVIHASQGRVRGYGHAATSILVSTLSLLGMVVTLFASGTRSAQRQSVPEAYRILVFAEPSRFWFQGGKSQHQLAGPASGVSDSDEVDEIVMLAAIPELESHNVLDVTRRRERDRETGDEILIWFAAVTDEAFQDRSRLTRSGPGVFMVKEGRTLMGVKSARDEAVVRLGEFYLKQMSEIPAWKK